MGARTRTQYKLEEARFFLQLLEDHWRHAPHFDYFLSAFVAAARSVTWIMRSEYSRRFPEWTIWFEEKKPGSSTRVLLKKMNDLRVRATHSDPVRTRTTAQVSIDPSEITPELMQFLESDSGARIRLESVNESNTEAYFVVGERRLAKARIVEATHELPEFYGQDVRPACREYLAELESLNNDCIARFGPKE
jgi:hypothetical protein